MTAACDGSDTNIWFEGTPAYNKELAVSICRGCPMRQQCFADHRTEPHGIFGGLTPSPAGTVREGAQMILTRVIRVHVRCDKCKSAWVFVDDPVDAGLIDVGWRVDGERHVCPRCARKAKVSA